MTFVKEDFNLVLLIRDNEDEGRVVRRTTFWPLHGYVIYEHIADCGFLQEIYKKKMWKWRRGIIHSNKGVTGSGQAIEDTDGGEYDHNVFINISSRSEIRKGDFVVH